MTPFTPESPNPAPRDRRDLLIALALFLGLSAIYFAAGTVYIASPDPTVEIEEFNPGVQDQFIGMDCFSVNDSSAVISQSLSLINDADITFRAEEIPHMLHWSIAGLPNSGPIALPALDGRLRDWILAGVLVPVGHHPQIVNTTRPGVFLNCFGMGGAITAAPAFALAQLVFGRLTDRPDILDRVAFAQGSLLVAASAAILYLALRQRLAVPPAIVLTIAYALGTCVFSTSSQGMWQHSATAFFSSIAILLLPTVRESPGRAYVLGFAMAMATLSRPTMGIIAAALAVQFLWTDRRVFLRYALAGVPFAALLLYTNDLYLGSPLTFGQTALTDHAFEKTGVAKIWQTPTGIGLLGLLVSPSRGLLVFSPFLLAAFAGIAWVFRSPDWAWARGIAVAVPVILVIEANHFDWWGGWSYGYRHLVDLAPFLIALSAPVAAYLLASLRGRVLFLLAVLFSIGVQVVGVTANDVWRWNGPVVFLMKDPSGQTVQQTRSMRDVLDWTARPGHTVETVQLNIDRPENRDRLWSLTDNQVGFYFTRFWPCTVSRQGQMWNARQSHARKLAQSYRNLAEAYAAVNANQHALRCLDLAFQADPTNQRTLLALWNAVGPDGRPIDFLPLFEQVGIVAPDDLAVRMYTGFANVEAGDLESAVLAFEDVLRRSPQEFQRRFDMGRELMSRKLRDGTRRRPRSAIHADVERVIAIMTDEVEARKAEEAGDWTRAEQAYDRVAKALPELSSLPAHRARLLARRGQDAAAWKELRAPDAGGSPSSATSGGGR